MAAVGLLLFQRVGHGFGYLADVLPAELVFALGLSMTVAPLTAAVLAGSEGEAGIASAVNNAVARVAGLIGTAGVGAVIAAVFSSSLKSHLRGVSLGSAGQAVLAEAKRLPLGLPEDLGRCRTRRPRPCTPPPKRPRCTPSTSASRGRGAGGRRRRRRAGLHPQPGPGEGAGRGMRRGPAGGGQQPGAGQAWPGRCLRVLDLARLAGVVAHRFDDRRQAPAPLGEAVLDRGRARRDHGAGHQAGPLEVAQALGEHPGGDAGDRLGELVEAQGPGQGRVDDR